MSNCYKVEVETTNAYPADTTWHVEGHYLDCKKGVLYILASKMSEVEKVVVPERIKSIELVGVGYVWI